MRTRRRGRANPSCVTQKPPQEIVLTSLPPQFEENAEGEGLHCMNPEDYWSFIEDMQAEAVLIGNELYWD
jgi:hypothetical protein